MRSGLEHKQPEDVTGVSVWVELEGGGSATAPPRLPKISFTHKTRDPCPAPVGS